MNAFQTIVQKYNGQEKIFIMNEDNNFEFFEYISVNKYSHRTPISFYIYYYFMKIFAHDSQEFITKKFLALNAFLSNMFTSQQYAKEMLTEISKIQRIYNGFSRLAHIFRYKRAKVRANTDLCMNDLDPKRSNVFVLFQDNQKYYFSARDLINILNRNLSNCISFVPEPIPIKNPYNNIPLTSASLYNIYFFLRWNCYVIPELFQGFFISNFNETAFKHDYEFNIINHNIKNYIYNSHHDALYPIFEEMWDTYNNITKKIVIDPEFPKDTLINIMKPYLHLYYTSLYATNGTYKQCYSEYYLRRKLMRFRRFNPKFGRKMIYYKRDIFKKRTRIVEFNSKHINFYRQEFQGTGIQQNDNIDYSYEGVEDRVIDIARILIDSVQRDTTNLNPQYYEEEQEDHEDQENNNVNEINEDYPPLTYVFQESVDMYISDNNNSDNDNEEEKEQESVS